MDRYLALRLSGIKPRNHFMVVLYQISKERAKVTSNTRPLQRTKSLYENGCT